MQQGANSCSMSTTRSSQTFPDRGLHRRQLRCAHGVLCALSERHAVLCILTVVRLFSLHSWELEYRCQMQCTCCMGIKELFFGHAAPDQPGRPRQAQEEDRCHVQWREDQPHRGPRCAPCGPARTQEQGALHSAHSRAWYHKLLHVMSTCSVSQIILVCTPCTCLECNARSIQDICAVTISLRAMYDCLC